MPRGPMGGIRLPDTAFAQWYSLTGGLDGVGPAS